MGIPVTGRVVGADRKESQVLGKFEARLIFCGREMGTGRAWRGWSGCIAG